MAQAGGDPCDSQRVERLWIKGHMHSSFVLLWAGRKAGITCLIIEVHLADDAFASLVIMY